MIGHSSACIDILTILHSIFYILYSIFYNNFLYSIFYILYSIFYILYSIFYILYSIFYILCLHSPPTCFCKKRTLLNILYSMLNILYSISRVGTEPSVCTSWRAALLFIMRKTVFPIHHFNVNFLVKCLGPEKGAPLGREAPVATEGRAVALKLHIAQAKKLHMTPRAKNSSYTC